MRYSILLQSGRLKIKKIAKNWGIRNFDFCLAWDLLRVMDMREIPRSALLPL